MYPRGDGLIQDQKAAAKWYLLAAEQGLAAAQTNLGMIYKNGTGVRQDNVYAHMWWNIAVSRGYDTATELRDSVAKRMTPSQIEQAQDLARECALKNYKEC